MWRRALIPAVTLGVLGLAAGTVLADPPVAGTYKLESRRQGSSFGPRTEVRVWIERGAGDEWKITRQEVYPDGRGAVLRGSGTVASTGWVRVSFTPVGGLANLPVFNDPTPQNEYRGTYRVSGNNIYGYFRGPDRAGQIVSRYETGKKTTDEPVPGADGGATQPDDGGDDTTPAGLADLGAKVVRVSVITDIDITDAGDSQFEQALDAAAPTVQDPAAILKNEKLRLRVFLKGQRSPAQPLRARLTGAAGGRTLFSQDVTLSNLTGSGQDFTLASTENLTNKVAINELNVEWKLDAVAAGTSPLRIYTIHARPRNNVAWDNQPLVTKRHLENACRWANGASQNSGQGAESIPYQIDNQMRHYVHNDELGNLKPAVPDYAPGAAKPLNYGDLGGWVSNGVRSISSLYYPPLEPDQDYENYTHYRNNFGWNLLDNPTHVGGRCNQQASLVCQIVGTVGIKGDVLYLERTGRGKRTGRPVRQYFYAQGGGGPWNFHGVALIDLDDGSQWIYDGSFSSPPRRKNGTREWAEDAGGPFIGSWADWYYEDFGGKVPAEDRPDTWQGVQ